MPWGWIIGGVIVALAAAAFGFWYCRRGQTGNETTPVSEQTTGRRLVVTPISEISRELRSTMLPVTPRVRQLRSDTLRTGNDVCDNELGLPGLDNGNIWWAIPLSCLTQLFWIYVIYRTYKACKSR